MQGDTKPSDRGGSPADSDYAAVVWRLAVDGGLPAATASDISFVTLQNLAPAAGRSPLTPGAGSVVRAALEQRAVARCLAAMRKGRPGRLYMVPKEAGR